MSQEIVLPRFAKKLEGREDVDYHQIWRYTKGGRLPNIIKWLAQNPDLAQALADDARDLSKTKEDAA